eukprot:TRINITY_DN75083_c0_g1_i1.p1 TRINITY_DN75083_c0_g1~~TRINITY_DN75083_c0_g1_i1.p1  ORF type:complete len:449 (-),score=78.96 TRINITY_DN75083_c0_g1_i1:7-1287(-)
MLDADDGEGRGDGGEVKRGDQACPFCQRSSFRNGGLQHHLRFQHRDVPGMLEKLASILPPSEAARARILGSRLHVVFEDDWLAVVVKPQGVSTQGKSSFQQADWLLGQLRASMASDKLGQARPAHRLDAGTGGLLVLSKTLSAAQGLQALFEEKLVRKRYRALVHGHLVFGEEGVCNDSVDGKPASTRYRVALEPVKIHGDWVSTVDLWPGTGRRHQLRKHMSAKGHPIVGDTRYGGRRLGGASCASVGTREGCGTKANASDLSDDSEHEDDDPLRRSFCLFALSLSFPHPARVRGGGACSSASIGDGTVANVEEETISTDFELKVTARDWDTFSQCFSAPSGKKKKAKQSNIVSKTIGEGVCSILEPGDLLVAIGDIRFAGGAAALEDARPADDSSEVVVKCRRSQSMVRASIEEPLAFRDLRLL